MGLQQEVLFSLLLVGSFLLINVNSECTWTRGDTCYTLVEEVQQQAQAQANCVEMYNGNLVSITSQDEDDFIRARYLDHFRNITAFLGVWTGGINTDGQWTWLSGEQWEYTNWAPDTPQGDGMGVNIDWINGDTPYGYFNFQWEWNDAPLDHFHPYLCESTQ